MSLIDYIRLNEGLKLDAYDDATGALILPGQQVIGTLTIGYGHTGHDVFPGLTWTKAHADAVNLRDIATAILDAEQTLGPVIFANLSEARQAAFCDLAYELGETKLATFHNMITAARANDWQTASAELGNSALAREVPGRVMKNQRLILTGSW